MKKLFLIAVFLFALLIPTVMFAEEPKPCDHNSWERKGNDTNPGCTTMGKGSWKCTICGKYWHPDIAPLGHYWGDPTCASPAKCKRCSAINPESSPTNSHDWIAATCMEKKHCKACGLTQGDLSDHKWNAAKCTERRRCTVCRTLDTIMGDVHTFENTKCNERRKCKNCSALDTAYGTIHNFIAGNNCLKYGHCTRCSATNSTPGPHLWVVNGNHRECMYCGVAQLLRVTDPSITE